jgi:hypothetical protein
MVQRGHALYTVMSYRPSLFISFKADGHPLGKLVITDAKRRKFCGGMPIFLAVVEPASKRDVSVQSTHLDRPQAAHLDCSCAPM